jgi:hypothetical protein
VEKIRMRARSETLHAHLEQLASYSCLSDDGRVAVETALALARDDVPVLLALVAAQRDIVDAARFMVRAFTEEDLYDTAEARLRAAVAAVVSGTEET